MERGGRKRSWIPQLVLSVVGPTLIMLGWYLLRLWLELWFYLFALLVQDVRHHSKEWEAGLVTNGTNRIWMIVGE